MTNYPIPLLTKKNLLLAMRMINDGAEDRQEARRKIIERAREIDCEYIIPANWNDDGTVSGA